MSSVVVLDTAAWWEVLHDTTKGRGISEEYIEAPGVRVATLDLALAEVSGKLARLGRAGSITTCLAAMEAASEVVPISRGMAEKAGPLQVELRRTDRQASLADAVMLAAARSLGGILISDDPAFEGQADVRRS